MKAKELIKKLEKLDQDDEIDFLYNGKQRLEVVDVYNNFVHKIVKIDNDNVAGLIIVPTVSLTDKKGN